MIFKQILEESESSGHKDFQKSILVEGTASVVPCRSSVLGISEEQTTRRPGWL